LGRDVPSFKFIEKARETNTNIIALSSLLSTSAWYQKDVLSTLKDTNLREKYWVIVGGGGITPSWAEEIGADGYGKYAESAVKLANMLIEKSQKMERTIVIE